jgi:ribosomal protein L21E
MKLNLKKLFKSKKQIWKEKFIKEYEEGKVLKVENKNGVSNGFF